MTRIPIDCQYRFPDGTQCAAERTGHIHEPTPCARGNDERHHEFIRPAYVQVRVNEHVVRVRVPA